MAVKQQAPVDQFGGGQQLTSQVVTFKQPGESESGDLISQARSSYFELGKLTKPVDFVQVTSRFIPYKT